MFLENREDDVSQEILPRHVRYRTLQNFVFTVLVALRIIQPDKESPRTNANRKVRLMDLHYTLHQSLLLSIKAPVGTFKTRTQ